MIAILIAIHLLCTCLTYIFISYINGDEEDEGFSGLLLTLCLSAWPLLLAVLVIQYIAILLIRFLNSIVSKFRKSKGE